jgi:hypothetical protein
VSATTIDVGEVPDLNEQQVEAILSEALAANYFELDVDGQLPRDSRDRLAAASELIRQSRLSYAVGNRSAGVMSLLFIAEVDQNPRPPTEPDTGGDDVTATEVDLTKQPDEALRKFEETLLNYEPRTQEVEENIEVVRAEMRRRGMEVVAAPESNGHAEVAQDGVSEELAPPSDERKALEDRLTFSAMRAHKLDPSQIPSLSDEELRWVVEHPGGEVQETPTDDGVETPESEGQTVETTRMVVDRQPEPQAPASKSGDVLDGITPEREELESQVSGSMLKAFGRGRVDVPSIGDEELRFMVENPEGRVTQEQLLAARALDEGTATTEKVTEHQLDETSEGEQTTVAEQREEPEVPDRAEKIGEPASTAEQQSKRMTATRATSQELPQNPAAEVIDREHFPVPPEIDERPPRLPFDMSKCSDDDVRSHHARFHACHSRANFVVGLWEGEHRDVVKLRKGREVEVANSLPSKDPEDSRKRLTDAQREAMVAADLEVVALKEREHEIERVLRQLTTLRDGYSRDVSACSRQWAMRHKELEGAGGLR